MLTKEITVDAKKASFLPHTLNDGLGMVSANNSSRLLLDYRSENRKVYDELLAYMFGRDGLNLSLLKIELGADIDSSSGTEPATKRSLKEPADVTRGAGYRLAADAMRINPDLKIDMLAWGFPHWVAYAKDVYAARYTWLKETIDALYDTYKLRVHYVTATQNERANDYPWIKYLSRCLKEETTGRYDYGTIQIVAGEAVSTWEIADEMLKDPELRDAVDVVSSHYTSFTSQEAKLCQREYGKKLWFSECAAPMSYSPATCFYDETGTGLSGINGMLDIAVRLTNAYAEGMTMVEFQPVIAAYYDGVTYSHKHLICADSPWNGDYRLDTGFYMALHFAQFIPKGWAFVRDACFGDGKPGGDGHAIVDSTFNYATAISPDATDFSCMLVNAGAQEITYTFRLRNFAEDRPVNVWETKSPEYRDTPGQGGNNRVATEKNYFSGFFQKKETLEPQEDACGKYICITVKPYRLMTLSTLDISEREYPKRATGEILSLPYADDFSYADREEDFAKNRGGAPIYTTDQTGAFEIVTREKKAFLRQKITEAARPVIWGGDAPPTTNLGDDRWHNYRVGITAYYSGDESECENNYVGVGLRYILADRYQSGYWLRLFDTGRAELLKDDTVVAKGEIPEFDRKGAHRLVIAANEKQIEATADGFCLRFVDNGALIHAGRAALYSNFAENEFADLLIEPLKNPYITRFDGMDDCCRYSPGSAKDDGKGWYFETIAGFKNHCRTLAHGSVGDSVSITFSGRGIALIGPSKEAKLRLSVDGASSVADCTESKERECFARITGLKEGEHTLTCKIIHGKVALDCVEIIE